MGPPGPSAQDDEFLLRRFAAGETAAFDEILARHHTDVARLVHRLLGWPGEVEDVVQEIFLRAFENLHKLNSHSSLSAWLYTIAVNRCRSHLRKQFLWRKMLGRGVPGASHAAEGLAEDAQQRAIVRETSQEVCRAVQDLPARYREAAVLHYLEGLSIERTSQVLGVTRNAVQVRLYRARARLRKALASRGID